MFFKKWEKCSQRYHLGIFALSRASSDELTVSLDKSNLKYISQRISSQNKVKIPVEYSLRQKVEKISIYWRKLKHYIQMNQAAFFLFPSFTVFAYFIFAAEWTKGDS